MAETMPLLSIDLQHETFRDATLHARLASVFDLREHDGADRAETEEFIHASFARMHGARIHHFMPRLLSLRSRHGEMIAAFGLREASRSRLFLENYLNHPIEEVLQTRLAQKIRREDIVEVGNLSALYPGAARWLIVAVTGLLYGEGYSWVTFTGTATLRNGFHRLGLRPVELGAATPGHLPEQERADWGSYYDQSPTVMAGDIAHGYHSLLLHRDLSKLLRAGIAQVDCGSPA